MIRKAKEGDVFWLVRNCVMSQVTFESGNANHRFVMVCGTDVSYPFGVFLYELFRRKADAGQFLLKMVRQDLAEAECDVRNLRSQIAKLEEEEESSD